MKKIVSILMCSILVLSIVGCKGKEIKDESVNQEENGNIESKENIGTSNSETLKNNIEETPKEEVKKGEVLEEETPILTAPSKTEETPSCTAKKFDNTYTYTYETNEECRKNASSVFEDIYQTKDDTIFSYGCEKIVDECGTTWYGVYFNRYSNDSVVKVYY